MGFITCNNDNNNNCKDGTTKKFAYSNIDIIDTSLMTRDGFLDFSDFYYIVTNDYKLIIFYPSFRKIQISKIKCKHSEFILTLL